MATLHLNATTTSTPEQFVAGLTDFGPSGHTYTLTRQPDGTTAVDVVVVREGKNLRGRLIGALLSVAGERVLGKGLDSTVKSIEARDDGAKAAGSS